MPLRDHFHSPVNDHHTWDELHGLWPGLIVLDLYRRLPPRYVAAPTIHLGTLAQIDVVAFDKTPERERLPSSADEGGVATATWSPPKPTIDVPFSLTGQDEYEVRIYDRERERQLVAAIEIVSPSNKDRPQSRQDFVSKCVRLLRAGVSVAIIDLVTLRSANLYADVLDSIGQRDESLGTPPPSTYAAECTWRREKKAGRLRTWSHTLQIGQPLPTLPLWLDDDFAVPLDLESTYEETCRTLRIE